MEKNDVIGLIGGTAILLGSFVIYCYLCLGPLEITKRALKKKTMKS